MGKGTTEIRKGVCPVCSLVGCHVRVHVRGDGKVVKIVADPESPLGQHPCARLVGAVDYHHHSQRLNYPLKRAGKRGDGNWERITWEQAIDEIAEKLYSIRSRFGPEAVAALGGGNPHAGDTAAWRWCNLWGTPNIFWQGKNCGEAEFIAESAIYGYLASWSPPVPGITKCILLWGVNFRESGENTIWPYFPTAKRAGAKMVVVDPRYTETAKEADIWLQLRPGTDGALLFGMINTIVEEELYDKEFVEKWCLGFDKVRVLAQKYSPDKVEGITWVPREKIVEVARLFATHKPAYLSLGMGAVHTGGKAVMPAVVGKCILRAITGNIDVEGGHPFSAHPYPSFMDECHWDRQIDHPLRKRDNVSAHMWPIASVKSLQLFREAMGRVYPKGAGYAQYFIFPGSHYIWSAILDEDPYPIKAVFLQTSNPLIVLGNGKRIYRALKSPRLELSVCMDRWMTPSAQLADYVLPAADALERPTLFGMSMWGFDDSYFAREKAVEPLYERKEDYRLWRDLGVRLGQEAHWPETMEQWFDNILKSGGVTFKELSQRNVPMLASAPEYGLHQKRGFATFSGKVELASSFFEKMGYDPLSEYEEPPWSPISNPDLSQEYPLILMSGGRIRQLVHSQHRQIEKLRRRYPVPLLQIHPTTAHALGINDGDPVYIETPLGRIRQKAKWMEGIDPRVVHADGYWWYPELPGKDPCLFGAWESNINSILPDEPDLCDYAGDNPFTALLCRVYRAKEL